jgi:hypothetical protein
MGPYLTVPRKDKMSEDGENPKVSIHISLRQAILGIKLEL